MKLFSCKNHVITAVSSALPFYIKLNSLAQRITVGFEWCCTPGAAWTSFVLAVASHKLNIAITLRKMVASSGADFNQASV